MICTLMASTGSGDLTPLSGLSDFLSWVDSRALRRAAVTNAPKANTELMLKALALDRYFEVNKYPDARYLSNYEYARR